MATSTTEATNVDVKVIDATEKDSQHSKATLFVRNIPYDATNHELEEFFSDLGPIRSCFVVMDKSQEDAAKPQNKGFGYVHYALAEDAQRAVTELKDTKFRGARKLKIEFALKKGEKAADRPAPKPATAPKPVAAAKPIAPKVEHQTAAPDNYLTIEVTGLGDEITKKHIYKRARKIATVENIDYPIEGKQGTAQIKFGSHDDAKLGAKQLDGHIFKGATLKANVMATGAPPVQRKTPDYYIDKAARLIVRNLPWKYHEPELFKLFGAHGKVHEVKLPRKFAGGPMKGFAFIQYGNIDDAEKAVNALNATEHHGRTIAVDWALAKNKYLAAEENAGQTEEGADEAEEDIEAADDTVKEEAEVEAEAMDVDKEGDESPEDENMDDEEIVGEEDEDEDEDEDASADVEEDDEDEEDIDIEDGSEEDDEDVEEGEDIEEEEEEEEEEDEAEKVKPALPKPAEGTTLFVRNLLFESQESDLRELFSKWGQLRYAKITMDRESGRSRGTGFVCFKEKSSADQCLEEAEQLKNSNLTEESEAFPTDMMSNKQKKKSGLMHKSLLTPDINTGLAQKFTLQGRVLDVNRAVERTEANKLMEANALKKQKEDKRNIYLMKEGVIFPDTPAAATIPEAELRKRQMSYAARKKLLAADPALCISKTRLSIRNLPLKVEDKDLKLLGMDSITNFKKETKSGQRTDLSADEKAEGWSFKPFVKQAKIIRSKDRMDAATKKLRSKGYGFLEFRTHAHALAALRYLNNNSKLFPGDTRTLIVEFSVDNKDVVERRAQRVAASREHGPQRTDNGPRGRGPQRSDNGPRGRGAPRSDNGPRGRGPPRSESGPRDRSTSRFGKRDGDSNGRPNKREYPDKGGQFGKRKPAFDDRKDFKRVRTNSKNTADSKKPDTTKDLTPQKKKALVRKRQFVNRK
ncbi:hypothetical protein INT43_005116 [Umbelopsis isabellina]|uniref:RRM domain-containing protein n=1 Tax=Mortierella isabellina TaxID=91625 RepID=A0A8H7PGT1_MORIS|nr:hypothetical protein INT43_005116 [Umbelopsis isabellina]